MGREAAAISDRTSTPSRLAAASPQGSVEALLFLPRWAGNAAVAAAIGKPSPAVGGGPAALPDRLRETLAFHEERAKAEQAAGEKASAEVVQISAKASPRAMGAD